MLMHPAARTAMRRREHPRMRRWRLGDMVSPKDTGEDDINLA